MAWSNYATVLLVSIVCSVSGVGLSVQTATLMAYDQMALAEDPSVSAAYMMDTYSRLRLGWLRNSGSPKAGMRVSFFSTCGRRLLQSHVSQAGSYYRVSHKLGLGGILGLAFGIPACVVVIVALVLVWLRKRGACRNFGTALADSHPPFPAPNEAPISNNDVTCTPTVDCKGFGSWMKSFSASSSTKAKIWQSSGNEASTSNNNIKCTPTVGFKGFGSWLNGFSASSSTKPKIWLSSACEMEFSELEAATDYFSEANLLGEGGSARVYRAKLNNGDFGAVKVIEGEGRHALSGFQSEVDLMRQIRHPNLVSLIGYCNQGQLRLLVYDLMQNGSLEEQLYGPRKGTGLSWNLRIKISLDSARGLEYLHEHCVPPVVHRDFKASNILLDTSFNAKISDFGLATPLEGLTQEESLQLIGTIGYVAPEFFLSGTLTEKSDVYAFGVTLLELLTGRKPIDHSLPLEEQSLVNWAAPQLTDRTKLPKLVAPQLRDNLNLKHLYQVAAVAALCVQKEPTYRPLIADVVQSLVPLVPMELGGALRSDASRNDISHQQQESLMFGSESFNFAEDGPHFHIPRDRSKCMEP